MSSPLHKSPQGLLGALDLKVLGQNPNIFSDTVVPIIDVYDQYLIGELAAETSTLTITNPATLATLDITCPPTDNWRVLGLSISGVLNVADTALREWAFLSFGNLAGISAHRLLVAEMVGSGVASILQRDLAFYLPRPLYCNGGGSFRFSVQMSATPAVSAVYTCSVLLQRIRA